MEKKDKTNKNSRCLRAGWSFAEAFYQISQISDNPRNAMRHCAEAIFTGPRSSLDINDIWALLEHNGVLETFEVSINANEENRMEQLVEQIRMHLDKCGHLTCILLIFYPVQDNPVTMDEIKELFKALPNECDACWDVEIDDTEEKRPSPKFIFFGRWPLCAAVDDPTRVSSHVSSPSSHSPRDNASTDTPWDAEPQTRARGRVSAGLLPCPQR